ncbi:hypothetical protein CDAR_285091 [Caerostris darwini]|uniref:Uncharacterized protein n=1 Tax=Caerostris darwini TaxID=1538125 RepID=A0AAV4VBN2_9ARAC|nr:hypothetical protein CDAR_285091 [Caerostris darwini]
MLRDTCGSPTMACVYMTTNHFHLHCNSSNIPAAGSMYLEYFQILLMQLAGSVPNTPKSYQRSQKDPLHIPNLTGAVGRIRHKLFQTIP